MFRKDKLKEARLQRKLTRGEAARRIGVTALTYGRWENDRHPTSEPRKKYYAAIERELGITEQELTSESNVLALKNSSEGLQANLSYLPDALDLPVYESALAGVGSLPFPRHLLGDLNDGDPFPYAVRYTGEGTEAYKTGDYLLVNPNAVTPGLAPMVLSFEGIYLVGRVETAEDGGLTLHVAGRTLSLSVEELKSGKVCLLGTVVLVLSPVPSRLSTKS